MERDVSFRRPLPSNSEGLSKIAKTFFGLNLFQVFAIGGIQGAMIIWGDFSPVSVGGLGPGRRIYMALFLGAILYSCLLCLFAVKKQNYLEILAFVFQNYGYIVYSFIQVYHISFKKYQDHDLKRQKNLVYLTLIDSGGLFILNIIFTCLAVKLYGEYGWKIYKRVRFNVRLRAAFHLYETVIMLVKMVFLFVTMYAICFTQTMFRGQYENASYIISMVSIPLSLMWAIFGIISIRRENRIMAYIYILGVLAALVYFIFKIIRIGTKTCTGCVAFQKQTEDIPGEVDLHLLYLASMNVLFILLLLLASVKAVRNFGIGLAAHFKESSSKLTVLYLSKNIFTSIVPSSAEENHPNFDIDSPRPSVSNEPRPSIFQLLPKFRNGHLHYDNDQGKGVTLPARFQKRDKLPKQAESSTKSRISQLFWESEIGHLNRSQQSSFSSRNSSSCLKDCCPWLKPSRLSFSTYGIPERREFEEDSSHVIENGVIDKQDAYINNNGGKRKRSQSVGVEYLKGNPKPVSRLRFNSLPNEELCRTAEIYENIETEGSSLNLAQNSSIVVSTDLIDQHTAKDYCKEEFSEIEAKCSYDGDDGERINDESLKSCMRNSRTGFSKNIDADLQSEKSHITTVTTDSSHTTHAPLRRIKSSISSISSLKTESTDYDDSDDEDTKTDYSSSAARNFSRKRKLGIVYESPDIIRKAVSDYDISSNSNKLKNVHFV